MSKATTVSHILDWKTVGPEFMSEASRTLCGRSTKTVTVANNPHDATCQKCRKKRDGR